MPPVAGLIQSKIEWERVQAQAIEQAAIADDPEADEKAIARANLIDFICHTYHGYEVNWHHQAFCKWIERLIEGDIDRLMLLVPPRHGKSECASRRLPAWALGKYPDLQVIACSYSASLASSLNRDVQRIIDTDNYRELFPDTTLNSKNVVSTAKGSYLRNSDIFEIVNHRGYYLSAGVGGGITGRGFKLGIIDDPIKNREEAESKTVRDGIWEWYTSTFRTRAEKGGKIMLILTPWHKDDLAHRLLRLAKEDPKADQWTVVKFPAIATEERHPDDPRQPGEALWEGKYPLEELLRIKASVGPYDWASLYQCSPIPDQASVFDKKWCRYWQVLPTFEKVVVSIYARFKEVSSAEPVCIQLWGRTANNQFYLLDQKRDRMGYLEARDATLEMIEAWKGQDINVSEIFLEGKRNGRAILESLAASSPVTVTTTDFGTDTEAGRAQAIANLLKDEQVLIPLEALWGDGFISEVGDFPSGESVNQVGAMTQALIYLALRAKTGLIYEFFNRSVHCLRGRDEVDFGLDPRLPLHISLDFNRHPATAVVGQVRGKDLFILREFYLLESNTFELSEAICGWVERSGHRDKIYVYGDASGNSRTANSQQSNWEIVWDAFKRYGLKNRSVKRYGSSNPPVRDTVISCNALFKAERVWILLSQCPELVKDLERVVWKGDEIDKTDLMRAQVSDGFRYLVHTLFPFRMIKLGGGQRSQRPVSGLAG